MSDTKNILLLDNYDSFTHNLFHYLDYDGDCKVTIKRNDEISLAEVDKYDSIVLSPGPGLPKDAGLMMEVIDCYHRTKKILGVCLGHQAIAEFFDAKLLNDKQVHHGISSEILIDTNSLLFKGIPPKIEVGRYHSWFVDETSIPTCITITARDLNDRIMAMEHTSLPICGVQFHPESILSEYGMELIRNWKK